MASKGLPLTVSDTGRRPNFQRRVRQLTFLLLIFSVLVGLGTTFTINTFLSWSHSSGGRLQHIPVNAREILSQCAALKVKPGPPEDFLSRDASERFEPGIRPTLIRNATIWTGANSGAEIITGDILLDKGIVKNLGHVSSSILQGLKELQVVDANGSWVTPGLVDLHSHVGVLSVPATGGTFDVGSRHGPTAPWLRSIDGFNTHDDAFKLAIAGGVTSAQVLPGSGNAIGGQAFVFKLRKTPDRSATAMIVEPPHTLNGTERDPSAPLHWRHMKQACGENLRGYGNRMDAIWSFRSAYNEARIIKKSQDEFCAKAEAALWDELQGQSFPENLQWEALVDVLRGRVKIANHCYEEVDFDDLVRLTNEFQFPIASFHHASEAWLVPEVLKRTWGGTPAIAIFATNHRYKRESYRGSEFAPRILADNDIPVVMKSDHPVLNSRYLAFEAQQAHYFGLQPELALASITSTPATAAGLSHRIGILQVGADADAVLWDTHPLQLGATPRKVWIDGILQVGAEGVVVGKGKEGERWQVPPRVPDWEQERREAVQWEGMAPLGTRKVRGRVVFRNVSEVWVRGERGRGVESLFEAKEGGAVDVVVEDGRVACVGEACRVGERAAETVVDLHGGAISPGLTSYGSPLGIEEIAGEISTGEGELDDPFRKDALHILGDEGGLLRAEDSLQFNTRNALLAHRSGVIYATSHLAKSSLFGGSNVVLGGLSTTFRTGAANGLEDGAVVKPITALHLIVGRATPYAGARAAGAPAGPSLSLEIAAIRRLLLRPGDEDTESGIWWNKAAKGEIPIVIDVGNADIMVALLKLKKEVEGRRNSTLKLVFSHAAEAHLIAADIANAGVGVILTSPKPFPGTWDDHRILPGPPLSNDTAVVTLLQHGVKVAIGIREGWQAANTRFDAAWTALETNGRVNLREAHALASANLEELLGVDDEIGLEGDLVAYDGGGTFDLSSKAVAIIVPVQKHVEIL
ncbi:hypothetical protein CERSUDRAFT_130402 [Gelatoporia subvermispora B]|uniref:Amidohydrolase-related domain-containing protein n=1 Tax=Ceriporiopsis subvermispora (strain B) TaxID=914234 RepID=M2RNT0_CERS8|nr:hypothetical protein CERSUDRAFT_130402 [Gelatoporia subvermispora B]